VQIDAALSQLVAPAARGSSGFFTVTLTWDGPGDVDLHVFEPDGSQVSYWNSQGSSGYLDVDNTVADGPEHYFASCDTSRLQVGTYRVAVANYELAEGRRAAVQVASSRDGVLGTKSITLGQATGDQPAYFIFDVKVAMNDKGQLYSSLREP
jgi:uncharacterized protein YfaP (DUF2135 family)